MQLNELKSQLVKKSLNPLYIFTGEEIAIMDIYIQKIVQISGCKMVRTNSVGSIFSKLQSRSFINTPSCYLVRDDKEYMVQDKVWQEFRTGKIQGKNIIILVYSAIDKRSKFYKYHKDYLISFDKLSEKVLAKYIKKEINISNENALLLTSLCDNNYSRILLECDKIKHLATAKKWEDDRTFNLAIKEKIIHQDAKDVIFEFIDSVCKRKIQTSYSLLKELNEIRESPLVMLSLLYNNFRSMLLVRGAGNCDNICNRTGLTPFQVKLAKEKGNKYDLQELVKVVRILREVERGIKIGQIDADLAIDYVLVNIL